MAIATLTSKGQVTVPKSVRSVLHLHTGDKLDFLVVDEGVVEVRPVTRKVAEVFGCLESKAKEPVALPEMKQRVSSSMRKKWA